MKNDEDTERTEKPGDNVTEDSPMNAAVEYDIEVCAAFQASMAERIGAGDELTDDPHVQSCARCSGLVSDLDAIARAARELMSEAEPSETLWDKLANALKEDKPEEAAAEAPKEPVEEPPTTLPGDLALETGSV